MSHAGAQPVHLSIIIPAYNEKKRLPPLLRNLIKYLASRQWSYEVIVVDDGSRDGTADRVLECQREAGQIKLIQFLTNQGKGAAVKAGMLQAAGTIVLFMDADGATALNEIEKKLPLLDQGFDLIIGSRVLKDAEHKVKAKWHRKIMGAVFNFLVQTLLFKDFKDTQCGFKMFRREAVAPIFSRQTLRRFGFDLEVLYLALNLGYKVKEVPVNWTHQKGSKVNLLLDPIKMFGDIFLIRLRHPPGSLKSESREGAEE